MTRNPSRRIKWNARTLIAGYVGAAMMLSMSGLPALASDTTVNTSVGSGSLTVTSDGIVALAPSSGGVANVSTSNQAVVGSVGVHPSDLRGTGAGWSLTAASTNLGLVLTATNFGTYASVAHGTSSGISSASGVYDGMNCKSTWSGTGAVNCGAIMVVVKSLDMSGLPATVDLYNPAAGSTGAAEVSDATATAGTLNSPFHGIAISMAGTTGYAVGDAFMLRVDAMPFSQLTYSPSAPTGDNGASTAGISALSAETFSGSAATSGPKQVEQAAADAGLGAFSATDGLSWNLHSNPLSGSYRSTLTFTIS